MEEPPHPPSSPVDDIPCHFLCPISLQLMSDPVTLSTGITYDRHHIHYWLFSLDRHTCPVTNQILPFKLLTPNLTLRRLIQSSTTAAVATTTSPKSRLQFSSSLTIEAEPSSACLDFHASVITISRADEDREAEPSRTGQTVEESLQILNRFKLTDSDLKRLGSGEFVDSLVRIMARC